jgi:uncharacterized protein (TIGR03382 family)
MSARRAGLALVVAAAALATPAAAYVRSTSAKNGVPLFWPQPAVPYVVSSHAASLAPSCGAPTGDGPALDAVKASFGAWEQSCSVLQLVYGGRLDDVRIGLGSQGEHLVVYRQGFCSTVAPACMQDPNADCATQFDCFEDQGAMNRSVVALTSVLYDENSGRIVDADIEVNAWDGQATGQPMTSSGGGPVHGWYFTCAKPQGSSACTTYGQDGCFFMDLQNTVTHEAGHFIGLAHVCEPLQGKPCTQEQNLFTMAPNTAPGDVDKRSLAQDDIDGVCAIYPHHSSGGGCASAGGAPAATALLLAAAALWRRRRGRAAR